MTLKNQTNQIRNLTTDQSVTYFDSFHGTDHQNSLHHPGSKPTQQASGAVQSTGLILCTIAEELEHPKPEEQSQQGIKGEICTGKEDCCKTSI